MWNKQHPKNDKIYHQHYVSKIMKGKNHQLFLSIKWIRTTTVDDTKNMKQEQKSRKKLEQQLSSTMSHEKIQILCKEVLLYTKPGKQNFCWVGTQNIFLNFNINRKPYFLSKTNKNAILLLMNFCRIKI